MADAVLIDLAMTLSYNDVHALIQHSPRLRNSFDLRAFDALYQPATTLPPPLLQPLQTFAQAPTQTPLWWRGPTDTGSFTLETADRSYVLHGHVYAGELAGKITAVTDQVVLHGRFSRGVPDGVWHTDHTPTTTRLSEETYVDGMRQGVSSYYYDLAQPIPPAGGGAKRYELEYVNNEAVQWRLMDASGRVERSGRVDAGSFV